MAVCKFGPLVTGIVGTLGGCTFKGGGSTGVVTNASRQAAKESAAQYRARVVLVHRMHNWDILGKNARSAWNSLAKSQSWPNKMSVSKKPNGRELFIYFLSRIFPDNVSILYENPPPTANIQVAPVVVSAPWHSTGTKIICVNNYPGYAIYEWLRITRHLEYGTRNSAGRVVYIGVGHRTSTTLNWDPLLTTAGQTFLAGERLQMEIWWRNTPNFPSPSAWYTTQIVP